MTEYARADFEDDEVSRIVKSLVTPRPIAWVSTVDANGVDNLAPFSTYNYLSSTRPVVMFNNSYDEEDGLKDSASNVLETGEFVLNLVTDDVVEQMRATAAPIPATESEFDHAGIERAPSLTVEPPRVAAALAHMECTLYDTLRVHDVQLVLGEVQHFHVSDALTSDGQIDMAKVHTVARCGGPYYAGIDLFE